MKIKKIQNKPYHNGNRLHGDGGNVRAKYGVFNQEGAQVGFVVFSSLYDAYSMDGDRLNERSFRTLSALKEHLLSK